MVMGDESSSRRARWVPRAARTVGRVRRAAGGGRHRGHWTGTEAAVVLVPHLRLMLLGRFAATVDVAERQELYWTSLVIVEELGVSSPLIGVAIWAPSDSSFGDVLSRNLFSVMLSADSASAGGHYLFCAVLSVF
ncbi:hypothetical protein [Oryza sativa Japonica Group]|uniref:Uncharacterized protein n=2 Tax=Oryza sativa subsp. japonica TaxID=39947 RepID=A0A979HJK0_ORYSJ|nr:hypothetical protein [Oryza sativa Japonica Group]BAS71699.1 Os01g0298901 [Oryza sativa Japonica Group]